MASKEDELRLTELSAKLDRFLAEFSTANINRKANELGRDLIKFLTTNPDIINDYAEISQFVEGLGTHWVNNQNPKVSQYGLEALIIVAEVLQSRYKNYAGSVFQHAVNRMGDGKETLREKARAYLLKAVEVGAHNPSFVLEKMTALLTNKNKDMATEAQRTILEVLTLCKSKKLAVGTLSDLMKTEINHCLSSHVREDAFLILTDLCERMNKRVIIEHLDKEAHRSAGHVQKRIHAFIEDLRAKEHGGVPVVEDDDEPDFANSKGKRTAGAKPKSRGPTTGMSKPISKAPMKTRLGEGAHYALHSGPTGEADENWFLSAFEDVPFVECVNHKEFEILTKKITDDLKTNPEFWEKKVDALKKLRSMIIHLTNFEDEVKIFIKELGLTLMANLKDLRSQVVREACLTFAFICKEYKNKADAHMVEIIMAVLMGNVMSSAKVIATASYIALKFMFLQVHHSRLISQLVQQLTNTKSKEVKNAACEFLCLILQSWPVNRLEQQISVLQDGLRKGCNEGTNEGRMAARKAFWAFRGHFPEQGEVLLNSMDAILRRQILASQNEPDNHENFLKHRLTQKSGKPSSAQDSSRRVVAPTSRRSNSAIDLQAVQRAKVRQQYAALARQKVGSGASLPRPKKDTATSGPMSGTFGPERTGRTRSRGSGVSQSQPGSRSGSPSSRLGYQTYNMPESNSLAYQSRRQSPRSQGPSRETSPNRFGSKSSLTNLLGQKRTTQRPPIQPPRAPMAHKMLAQSLEAEHSPLNDLYDGDTADSLGHKVSPRKTSYRPFEDHSDDSDASSLCSERSFDSYRRTSDSYSWSGSQQRLYRDVWESGTKDIVEIIQNCESTLWSDRKEGLVALQAFLQAGNTLNPHELKRITDCFTRMFMDSHTKVFSLFLDTLNELINVHRADLNSWLYVLLTRLLNKLGADLLGSIQNKILKSLDVVREAFPPELQMSSVLRFLTDPTQTPNLRVKMAALNFITKLAAITDPGLAFPPPSPGVTRDPVQAALHKMIGWTMGDGIKQGNELRRAAQDAIIALFNLNTPQVTIRMANLPQEYQEAASALLKGRIGRGIASGGGIATTSPPSPSSREYPRMSSPAPQRHLSRPAETDVLNPEEIYRSLRKTTAEIQNYTYEAGTEKPPDKDNTTSKDSGISQLSGTEALEEAMEELSIQSSSSSNATTTTLTNRVLTVRDCNGMDTTDNTQQDDGAVDEHEAMRKIVESLKSPPDSDNGENISIMSENEKRASLGQLTRLIRDSSVTVLQENFKALLRILLGNLALDSSSRDIQTRILVLTALTELIKKRAMTEYFNHYVELLILKVLNSYKDSSKEVVRSAESCANTIATTLAPVMVIRVLAPLIQTGEYPLNLAAIKMLTKLVDTCGRDPIYQYLPDLMPGLIQAYDNQESSVRKSAVFCMVSLHGAIGEEDLKPHLVALNGSKLKLLHLYIRRSQQGSSAPTSPRNHPPPSS